MENAGKITLLTLNTTELLPTNTTKILHRRCRKKVKSFVQHVQNFDSGCDILLPEENSMVNFKG